MNKWRMPGLRGRIASRWLFNELMDEFGIPMKGKRKNPVWYGEAVWLDNIDMDWMQEVMDEDDLAPKAFQKAVRDRIDELKEEPEYIALSMGFAPDDLIDEVLYFYYLGRKCYC